RRGIVALHEAFGRLRPELDSPPVQLDTIYPLASLTKPITATAIMCLVEDGLLGLNRPVAEYLPEFVGEGKQAVMVHHLLTHTSGLRDVDVFHYAETKRSTTNVPPPEPLLPPEWRDQLQLSYDAPLAMSPGTEMSYCNTNYELLAAIVERV